MYKRQVYHRRQIFINDSIVHIRTKDLGGKYDGIEKSRIGREWSSQMDTSGIHKGAFPLRKREGDIVNQQRSASFCQHKKFKFLMDVRI